MPQPPTTTELPLNVCQLLDAVRRRIRTYVWLEGIAAVVVTLGLAFWFGLALDWLFEASPAVRRFGLIAIALTAIVVCYRYLLRRVFVPISHVSAALLLERRFPGLHDHVITAVDVATAQPDAVVYNPELVAKTNQAATAAITDVNPRDVFDRRPLVRKLIAAASLVASLVVFAVFSSDVFGFWLERMTLSEKPWPRRVQLEVVGFPPNDAGERMHKLAQDDDFELLVHARADEYEVPDEVEIRFRLADGRRGRDTLTRVGDASTAGDDQQVFRYEFKRVAGDMDFDIVGGDDRVSDLHLKVVDRPELVAIELECVYPKYLRRDSRRLHVTGGMRVPEGTRLELHAKSTKPLTVARIHTAKDKQEKSLSFSDQPQQTLAYDYGVLSADDVLLVDVTDSDGVSTREPYRISLSAVKDEVPQIAVRLAGISTAITPDAILPFVGTITDDYGLDGAWFAYQIDAGQVATRPIAERMDGQTTFEQIDAFDTRALDNSTGKRTLDLKPKQRLTISLKAADRFDLQKEPRSGSSQQFALEVVTPAELLALLERRELALRQRFEAIYEKVTDTRNLLNRVSSEDLTDKAATANAAETNKEIKASKSDPTDAESTTSTSERLLSRTRLRIAGSLQNVVQSTDEISGVAEAFDDLGNELTNNRIDNPDLKSRLGEQIARPLRQIAEQRMPQLIAQLKLVEEHIEDPAATTPNLKQAIAYADQILVEMRQVLDRMLELENYNEVVALLRDIISDQERVNRQTKDRQKERLRSLFED